MSETSRTSKSIKNAKVALIFYFINLVLQFFSRKVFLDYLGAEVLGLNTTAQNLLGFLNMAELGIVSAVSYALYKPLFQKDVQSINEIVSVQAWLYRKIAVIIAATACVLMCFFPLIFEKAKVPMWYTYASFSVLLFSSLLGYIFNYRQIVLTADQKEYKVTQNMQGVKVVKIILQVLAITYLQNGYIYWLTLEVLMAIVTTFIIEYVLRREYPWLHPQPQLGAVLRRKHPEVIRKTKQIFFHKIGHFAFAQSSSIIIYAYASLSLVAIYGNYMLVVLGIQLLINAIFNSISAGIGNLVAENNRERTISIFNELFVLRFFIVAVVCYGYYIFVNPFITLWIGPDYLLDHTILFLIVTALFVDLVRSIIDSFLNAYGLFQDVWATITEACLNVGCSIVLGSIWGLRGILIGGLISLLLIIFLWKPYFLFKWGFRTSVSLYWKLYLKCFAAGICSLLLSAGLFLWLSIESEDYLSQLFVGIVRLLLFTFCFLAILYYINASMRQVISRIYSMMKLA